jgi:transposase
MYRPSNRRRTTEYQPSSDHQWHLIGAAHGRIVRDLPERYRAWSTVYSRFYRWREAGIWDRIFSNLQAEADATAARDWAIHDADRTVVRAH